MKRRAKQSFKKKVKEIPVANEKRLKGIKPEK